MPVGKIWIQCSKLSAHVRKRWSRSWNYPSVTRSPSLSVRYDPTKTQHSLCPDHERVQLPLGYFTGRPAHLCSVFSYRRYRHCCISGSYVDLWTSEGSAHLQKYCSSSCMLFVRKWRALFDELLLTQTVVPVDSVRWLIRFPLNNRRCMSC